MTVGAYGLGKFTVNTNCASRTSAAIRLIGVSGVIIKDCKLIGNNGGAPYGIFIENSSTNILMKNITVLRCDIGGFYTNDPYGYGGEIFVSGCTGVGVESRCIPSAGINKLSVIQNVLHGLDGPGSPDDNGYTGAGTAKNITNVIIRENHVFDIGGKPKGYSGTLGNGILVQATDGAVVERNVVHDLAGNVNTCGGAAGIWAYRANNVKIKFNEAYNVRPLVRPTTIGCDWNGFDFDRDVTNSVMEFNYSHDNYGAGYLLFGGGIWGPNTVRFNVSENDGQVGNGWFAGITVSASTESMPFQIYNNTIYTNVSKIKDPLGKPGKTPGITFTNGKGIRPSPNGLVANNIFFSVANTNGVSPLIGNQGTDVSSVKFLSNNYYSSGTPEIMWFLHGVDKPIKPIYTSITSWQSATGQDPRAITVNPKLRMPGSAGICKEGLAGCLSAYQFINNTSTTDSEASPMVGTGVNLRMSPYFFNTGLTDLWGNLLPKTSGFNIGVQAGP